MTEQAEDIDSGWQTNSSGHVMLWSKVTIVTVEGCRHCHRQELGKGAKEQTADADSG